MTIPTDDAPRGLDDLLHDLAERADLPASSVADDLARGRGRLRRRRAAIGAAALAAVVVGGGAVAAGVDDPSTREGLVATSPRATDPAPVDPTPTRTPPPPSVDPRDAQQLLTEWRDVIAEHLDPGDRHLERVPSGYQSGGGLGAKLGWENRGEEGLGMVQVFVSDTWANQFYMWCDRFQDCRDVRVDGVRARVMTNDGETSVGVEHPEGFVVVVAVNTLFGNNSTVPVTGLDVSVADLVSTAADERFSMPSTEQIAGASEAFGFPG